MLAAAALASGCVAAPPGPVIQAAPVVQTQLASYGFTGRLCSNDGLETYRIGGGPEVITVSPPRGRFVDYARICASTFRDAGGPGTYTFGANSMTWSSNNARGQLHTFSRC